MPTHCFPAVKHLPVCVLLCTGTLFLYYFYFYNGIDLTTEFTFPNEDSIRTIWKEKNQSDFVFPKLESDIRRIKIVLWTSPKNPPMQSRMDRMRSLVNVMNSKQSNFCSNVKQWYPETIPFELDSPVKKRCEFSLRRGDVKGADAVLFFMFTGGFKLSDLPDPSKRNPEQLWVMYAQEPPVYQGWLNPMRYTFNWTMTYRMDADVWTPYGRKIRRHSSSMPLFLGKYTFNKWLSGKTKLSTAVISRCNTDSQREILITEMKNAGIAIDVYGECGNKTCGRYDGGCLDFWNEIAKQYKFYLAFENSVCHDYITEKFWRSLELGIVPVVFGGGNYTLEAPPNSYIDVRNFRSTNHLGMYLKMLDENRAEYAKYFEWRTKYDVDTNQVRHACILCESVYDHKRKPLSRKTYLYPKWWYLHLPNSYQMACQKNTKLNFYNNL